MLQAGDGIANGPGHKDIGGLINMFVKLGPQPPRHPSEAGLAPGSLLDASRNKQPPLIGLKIRQRGGQVYEPWGLCHPTQPRCYWQDLSPCQHRGTTDHLILGAQGASSLGAAQPQGGQPFPPSWWGPSAMSPPHGGLCWLICWLLVGKHHPKTAKCFPKLF